MQTFHPGLGCYILNISVAVLADLPQMSNVIVNNFPVILNRTFTQSMG